MAPTVIRMTVMTITIITAIIITAIQPFRKEKCLIRMVYIMEPVKAMPVISSWLWLFRIRQLKPF